MLNKAVRLYGQNDLRLEEFEMPEMQDDEILAKIISDSICMSTYKAAIQGENHKRVPKNISEEPIIVGHEFCGEILKVGKKWQDKFKVGQKFSVQPALNRPENPYEAPGYSYKYFGGDSQYIIIPSFVMELDCLLPYDGDAFFYGSLSEPMSCIVGGYHSNYHTHQGKYIHDMGIVEGGSLALLASAGPMGMGAIDYAIHCDRRPSLVVVTDIDSARLDRAASIFTPEEAQAHGVKLVYVNTANLENPVEYLKSLTPDGKGYNDVIVFAPVKPVVEQGGSILAHDGCLNFFAGPTNPAFSAEFNFYNVHYTAAHLCGTSGGNTDDMKESLRLMESGTINPAAMITHIGGLDAVAETTLNLPKIPGGKKLIYTNISLPLTAISDFEEKGKTDPFFAELAKITKAHNGLWCCDAEKYLLANANLI